MLRRELLVVMAITLLGAPLSWASPQAVEIPEYLLPAAKPAPAHRTKGRPWIAAVAESVHVNAMTMGRWQPTPTGFRWQLRFFSVGASSLAIRTSPVRLPQGARVIWQSPDEATQHELPLETMMNLKPSRSPSISGPLAVLTIEVPASVDWSTMAFVIPRVYIGLAKPASTGPASTGNAATGNTRILK